MVCIIDDREDVWSHATNLIHVKPYHFFQHTGDINAPPGLDKHENDDKEGVDLTNIKKKEKSNGENTEKSNENNKTNQSKTETKEDDINDSTENLSTNESSDMKTDECETKEDDINGKTKGAETNESSEDKTNECETKDAVKNDRDVDSSSKSEKEVNGKEEKACSVKNNGEKVQESKNEEKSETPDNTNETKSKEDDLIEIEDPDDYLLHLEDILKRIHEVFYEEFDRMESGEVPDLKRVIPEVRSRVLKGTKLVFSGLVPTHIKLEQSKAYQVARSLGAEVTQDLEDDTTHLVAVRPGTAKVL